MRKATSFVIGLVGALALSFTLTAGARAADKAAPDTGAAVKDSKSKAKAKAKVKVKKSR
jgi:hypothetical protein